MTAENTPERPPRTRSNLIAFAGLAAVVALVVGVIVWASSTAPADGAAAPAATASTAPGEHTDAPGDSIDDTSATPTPTPTPTTTTAEQQELYDLMLNADPDTLERDLCGSDLLVLMGLGPVKPHPGYAAEGIVQYLWSPYLLGTDLYVEYHLVDGVAMPVDDTVVIYPDKCEVPAAELAIR